MGLTRTSPLVKVWPLRGLPALVIYTLHHPLIYTTITTSRISSLQKFMAVLSKPNLNHTSLTRTSPLVNVCPLRGLPALVIYTLHHPLIYTLQLPLRTYSLYIHGGFKQIYSEPNSLTQTSPFVNVWPQRGLPALVIYTLHHTLIYTLQLPLRTYSLQIQGGFSKPASNKTAVPPTSE